MGTDDLGEESGVVVELVFAIGNETRIRDVGENAPIGSCWLSGCFPLVVKEI